MQPTSDLPTYSWTASFDYFSLSSRKCLLFSNTFLVIDINSIKLGQPLINVYNSKSDLCKLLWIFQYKYFVLCYKVFFNAFIIKCDLVKANILRFWLVKRCMSNIRNFYLCVLFLVLLNVFIILVVFFMGIFVLVHVDLLVFSDSSTTWGSFCFRAGTCVHVIPVICK